MNNDVEKLLKNLEPVIDKKCMEIKNKKEQKRQNRIMMLLCICYIIIPSILLIFNISVLYFIIGTIITFTLRFFIKLPDILKRSLGVNCYE